MISVHFLFLDGKLQNICCISYITKIGYFFFNVDIINYIINMSMVATLYEYGLDDTLSHLLGEDSGMKLAKSRLTSSHVLLRSDPEAARYAMAKLKVSPS